MLEEITYAELDYCLALGYVHVLLLSNLVVKPHVPHFF